MFTSPHGWSLLQHPSPPRQVIDRDLWYIILQQVAIKNRIHTLHPQSGWENFLMLRWHWCLRDAAHWPRRIHWIQSWRRYTFTRGWLEWFSCQFVYPAWESLFWWSSHLARHCIRSVEACDSVLYCSQLLEDNALLASNMDPSSIVPVLWVPTRLKIDASSKYKFLRFFSQLSAIVQISWMVSEIHGLLINIYIKLKIHC